MLNYFKKISKKNTCAINSVCSIHPSVHNLYEILMDEVRETCFYLVKLKEFNISNSLIENQCIEALSVFLINTNFNKKNYLNYLGKIYNSKKEVKEKYLKFCQNYQYPSETINSNFEMNDKTTISKLIEHAQNNMAKKEKVKDKSKEYLFSLITIFSKLACVDLVKIKKFEPDYTEYDFEIIRFFALTNGYSIRNEKIKRRITDFSNISYKIQEKLNDILEKRYGKKEKTTINTNVLNGNSILITGDDLNELENLLKQIEEKKIENINIYTNAQLITAHSYPYFKHNKHIKGHIESDNAEYDFSNFKGAILITQNFVQKIDNLYRGEIFSNKIISFEKVVDIVDNDYSKLIETSLNLNENQTNTSYKENIKFENDFKKISSLIENYKNDEIIVIVGNSNNFEKIDKIEDKSVLNFSTPSQNDILYNSLKLLEEKNIKISLFIYQCTLNNLHILLNLLNHKIDFYLSDCSNFLVNPHVIESLKNDFNVQILT